MTTRDVPTGSQDFETDGGQLPYVDVVHAAGPATDVDQDRPRHWRPREPKIDHWCEQHGPYIKGSRLHVLKTIGSYAELTTGIAVVGIETLAKVCQMHPRQVRRIIKDLATKHVWFVIVERPRGDRPGHSNEYHLSGAATRWAPVRQETNAFETKDERASRRLNLALELLKSNGVEIPEELQDNSECPPNDDRGDPTERTFLNAPRKPTYRYQTFMNPAKVLNPHRLCRTNRKVMRLRRISLTPRRLWTPPGTSSARRSTGTPAKSHNQAGGTGSTPSTGWRGIGNSGRRCERRFPLGAGAMPWTLGWWSSKRQRQPPGPRPGRGATSSTWKRSPVTGTPSSAK